MRQRMPGGAVTVVQEADAESITIARPRDRCPSSARTNSRPAEERDHVPLLIFPYGVSRNKIERAISQSARQRVDCAQLGRCRRRADAQDARAQRVRPKLKQIASDNIPIYSIKTNTTTQIQTALRTSSTWLDRQRRDRDARGRGSHLSGAARQPARSSSRRRRRTSGACSISSPSSIGCSRAAPASSRTVAYASTKPPTSRV